jgi:hypothetical protein
LWVNVRLWSYISYVNVANQYDEDLDAEKA